MYSMSPTVLCNTGLESNGSYTICVCYTSCSSTVFEATFDSNAWNAIWEAANDLYGTESIRPSRRLDISKTLLEITKEYASSVQFIAEFPSLQGIPCGCPAAKDLSAIRHRHVSKNALVQKSNLNPKFVIDTHRDAYNIVRRPAKEIVLAMISDLDRSTSPDTQLPHALPISYYMGGYSLKMASVRSLISELLMECTQRELSI